MKRTISIGLWWAALAAGTVSTAAASGPILQMNGETVTAYKGAASSVQGIYPLAQQRGVFVDGTLAAASGQGWSLAGNPFGEGWDRMGRLGNLRLDTLTYSPTEVDLTFPAQVPWVVGRTYNSRQENSGGTHIDSNGYQGYNWFQISQPEIVTYVNSGDHTKDMVYIVYGADRFLEFSRTSSSSTEYRGVNGCAGVVQYVPGSPDTYVYYDQRGYQTFFFGGNADTIGHKANYQIWKIVDPEVKIAYVGNSSVAATAVTDGTGPYGITSAYDSSGRLFTYTYGIPSGDSTNRLTSVVATSGETEIGGVEYGYHSGSTDNGSAGDLKWVKISTPLSSGSGNAMTQVRYFRYYKDEFNLEKSPGSPHAIKLELAFEGARQFDSAHSFGDFYDDSSVTDADLKPYSVAYLTYEPNNPGGGNRCRVNSAIFNGECGCSGGTGSGPYLFAYDPAAGYATALGNTSYDNGWVTRTIITQPDGNYVTQHFDETGQPLSRVVTTSAPPSSGTCNGWVTEVVRTSTGPGGLINEIHTPADNTSYLHSAGTFTRSGTGLVHYFERIDGTESGWTGGSSAADTTGFVKTVRYSQGSVGTPITSAYCLSATRYQTSNLEIVSGTYVARPFVQARRAYKTATFTAASPTLYDETSYAYTFYSSTATNVLVITPSTIETTLPTVVTANNGSNSPDTVNPAVFLLLDGRTAFTRSADNVIGYTGYDPNRQVSSRILDADTTSLSPPSGFGMTGTPLHYETIYAYDDQGRPQSVSLPSGRLMAYWYDQLGDRRRISFGIKKFVLPPAFSSGSASGDVDVTVTDHSCNTVWAGTMAVPESGTVDDLSGWVSTAMPGPPPGLTSPMGIVAFRAPTPIGKLVRAQARVYDSAGAHLLESHSYHTYDFAVSTGDGSEANNYDVTLYGYDGMGRVERVKQPSYNHAGTITRTVFDALGRVTERRIGTNDNGDSGGETSGTNNMTKVEVLEYDGGGRGNSLLTTRTLDPDGDWTGATDQRVTGFTYDFRGRLLLQTNPEAPHTLNKYDNLGRLLASAQYSSTGSITVGTTDPSGSGTQANRITLFTSQYDERGRIFRTSRYPVAQSDGSFGSPVQSLTWYDPLGRVIKVRGEQVAKTKYDRLGRITNVWTLALDGDSNYAGVWDDTNKVTTIGSNTVLEEAQTAYENSPKTGNVLMRATISRRHDDSSTTGALDSNADGDPMKITAANVKGRIQITAMWYDDLDRLISSVNYGTNGIVGDGSTTTGTFDRTSLSAPGHNSGPLQTDYAYTFNESSTNWDGGMLYQTTSPGPATTPMKTRMTYDLAGRQRTVTRNYDDGGTVPGAPGDPNPDSNQKVTYAYSDGLRVTLTANMPGSGNDQTTTYTYGTTKRLSQNSIRRR